MIFLTPDHHHTITLGSGFWLWYYADSTENYVFPSRDRFLSHRRLQNQTPSPPTTLARKRDIFISLNETFTLRGTHVPPYPLPPVTCGPSLLNTSIISLNQTVAVPYNKLRDRKYNDLRKNLMSRVISLSWEFA